KAAVGRFRFNILGITAAAPGGKPVITFSVTDPTRNDAPYDLKADPAFTAAGGASALAVKLGWTTAEFANDGSGQAFGQPIGIDALTTAAAGPTAGTYTITSPVALPALAGTLRTTLEAPPAGAVSTPGRFT